MSNAHWWQTGVVYQIYPRSFADSNGDGIGDLPGITARLDYLRWLGVDAIWISPIYPSPMADFGYDVADYTDVHPIFGSLADFDRLVAEAHAREIRVILDLVPNHSSDEHPWFVQSRSGRDNPYRDWYIWRDPGPDGGPPNNWVSHFGSPAWSFDEASGQYYLHLFEPKQPDLNWRNPAVREAIYDAMRFWFRRGVDGFRIDVISMVIKHPDLPDNPPNPDWDVNQPAQWRLLRVYDNNQPEMHGVIREMRQVADEFPERVLIGEVYLEVEELVPFYGANFEELHLPFNFSLITIREWGAAAVGEIVRRYEAALPAGAWPNWVLGNHDQPRVASRLGPELARAAQMLLLTLRGTPTLYYGDELGMENVPIPQAMVVDPQGLRTPGFSRDPARTPMQWEAGPGAGFTGGRPWLPLAADYPLCNVALQREEPDSMLQLTRALLALRRAEPALSQGSYTAVEVGSPDVLSYVRAHGGRRLAVALNFGEAAATVDLSALGAQGVIRLSTGLDRSGTADLAFLGLEPGEGLVLEL